MHLLLATNVVEATGGNPSPAEDLVRRLQFAAHPVVEAVHVIAPSVYSSYAMEGYRVPDTAIELELENEERIHSGEVLQTIANRFESLSCLCRTKVLKGPVVLSLLQHADETKVDLIAVNGTHTKEAMALLEGSVVRSLMVDAHCSLLIAKDAPEGGMTGPLKVVLATDHSDYANRCIERLLQMSPQGIGSVTILTTYPMNELRRLNLPHSEHLAVPLDEAVQETLMRRNTDLIAHLREHLCATREYMSRVVAGDVPAAIASAMEETGADLLILGARGHGFVSRLTLGSISYRAAVASPYSVLVLRDGIQGAIS
jgi:nucleotide-binding universal stress UspA family protein